MSGRDNKPKGRVGIRDVALAAGVSPTTVSHSLSGKGRLPRSTRERIAKLATELGYRPNANARNLVSGKTGLLGITISESSESSIGVADFDYFIQLLTAATMTAVESGMALVVAGTGRASELFKGCDVDGLIVIDPVFEDPLVSACVTNGTPVVTTGRVPGAELDGQTSFWVDNDHVAATTSILQHLMERGGTRGALLTSAPVTSYTRDAKLAYEIWCKYRGQEPLISIAEGPVDENAGFEAVSRMLDSPQPPDAIYATLDRLALGALSAARARALNVPRDLILAGCTDSRASQWADPPLTAVALNPEEIGRCVVEMLISVVLDGGTTPCHEIVPTTIIPRESTARVAS